MNTVYMKLMGTISLGIGLVLLLFLMSERQVHRNNAFTRRYPPHPIVKQYDLDIGYNSYYIAGMHQNQLYLGNSTAPWHLLQIDLKKKDTAHIKLTPKDKGMEYRSIKIHVDPPHFFVMDGLAPFVLRGRVGQWIGEPWMRDRAYFNKAIPLDSNSLVIRTRSARTQEFTLGTIKKMDSFQVKLYPSLLQKQIDGVFDVDGILLKDMQDDQTAYVYYYRNQFMVMDPLPSNPRRQRTIDTVQWAQIQIADKNRKGRIQMKAPPLKVNKSAAMNHDLMLIQSDRLGRNEDKAMLDQTSIIDVYNHRKGTYEFSFYLYDIKNNKVREFAIHQNLMVALIGPYLSVYGNVHQALKTPMSNKN
jgi:hypothetical protein